jgi:peptidoglycan/xylan/chitin deacetylase (PgdA/CDA1 family)
MEKLRVVTTSWDDGDETDLKLAEMLRQRKVGGTFYVPINPYRSRPVMSHAEWKNLSADGFEIGAHGVTHQTLWKLSAEELAKEITPCKPILEDILGKEVRMFCYPKGRYDSRVMHALKGEGYWGARTVQMLSTGLDFDPFEMPTTLQICHHPKFNYIKNVARARRPERLGVYLANRSRIGNWLELGKKLFDSVLKDGGIWHLYGHSREVDDWGMWKELEEMLDYVAQRKDVMYVPNCELIRMQALEGRQAGNGQS